MKKIIAGFEIECPPEKNPFGEPYKYYEVTRETEKAYQINMPYYGKFGCYTNLKWVPKSQCKVDENGDVFVNTLIFK